MIRFLLWFALWLLTLTSIEIHIRYTDGLEVHLRGWERFRK